MPGFDEFRAKYGATARSDVPSPNAAVLERYKGRVPEPLIEEWEISGLAGFADGFLWLAEPDSLTDVIAEWKPEPAGVPFARTGFGDIFLWNDEGVYCLGVHDGQVDWVTGDFVMFFNYALCDQAFLDEVLRHRLYVELLPRLGAVNVDEMYTFVPALVLGGEQDAAHVQKVKMREQLFFLAQAHGR
jgi:hypothetical protein